MAETAHSVTIVRPRREVWAALADFGAISRWAPNVDHSCLTTSQREGVGTQRRVQVGRNALLERVLEWAPEHRLAYELEGLPPALRSVVNSWELAESDSSTTATLTSRIDGGSRPPQKLIAHVLGRVLGKASREMLDGLKSHVEQDPDGAFKSPIAEPARES